MVNFFSSSAEFWRHLRELFSDYCMANSTSVIALKMHDGIVLFCFFIFFWGFIAVSFRLVEEMAIVEFRLDKDFHFITRTGLWKQNNKERRRGIKTKKPYKWSFRCWLHDNYNIFFYFLRNQNLSIFAYLKCVRESKYSYTNICTRTQTLTL